MLHIPSLFIAPSAARGRGVFTATDVVAESLIELCPLLILPAAQIPILHQTVIHDYYFLLPDANGNACLPMGYGCLYNHSETPNAEVRIDSEHQQLEIHSIKNITAGEEILIDYQDGDRAFPSLWFEVA